MSGIRLEWAQFGDFDSFDVLRAESPMDINSLPSPLVTGLPTMFYIDDAAVEGSTYYYRVRAWRDGVSEVSTEISIHAVTGDEYWNQVVSLLHFDSSLADEKGNVWANNGATFYDGGIDTSAGYIEANNAEWNNIAYGQGDFTIECFIKQTATNNAAAIFTHKFTGLSTHFPLAVAFGKVGTATLSNQLYFGFFDGAWSGADSLWSPTNNTWHHIAASRAGNIYRLFADGVLIASFTSSNVSSPALNFIVGKRWDDTLGLPNFKGVVKEFRLTKGIARYTADFVPPDAPFPSS